MRLRFQPGGLSFGRDFDRLWTAASVSYLGDGVSMAALPLLAASLTGNAALVGLSGTVTSVPWLFLGLVSGTLVDRWDRLRVMWIVDGVRFLLVVALAVTVATGHADIALLLGAGLMLGIGQTLFDTASQATVPSLVAERGKKLEGANGRLSVSQTVGEQFAGPPAGGLLFAEAASAPLFANAASFGISALMIRKLALRRRAARTAMAPKPAVPAPRASMPHEIREGVAWLLRHRTMRVLAVTVGVVNLTYTAGSAVFVLYVRRELHLGPPAYGMLLAATAVGAVLGGLLVERATRSLGPGRILSAALGLATASRIGLALTHEVFAAAGALLLGGMGITVFAVVSISFRQRLVPDRLQGRVLSAYRMIALSTEPLGGALGGILVDRMGVRAPFLIGGGLLALLTLVTIPLLSNRSLREAAETEREEVARYEAGSQT
ncbi:MFS transporter [Actinospica durhamensis]|uniref:MFS transporter n=1 Tax=Actinospica durhamensis TaxID=1508375 RepID=A0A941IMZ2_9ACTN|nr:MFS transporter [Actinospica durhamensis]MBR7833399.1 MFS transporter [Actinospica durhamensis]